MANVVTAITDVWTAVSTWFVATFATIPDIFYDAETGLTFVGVLAIFGAGIGIVMGLMKLVRGWIKAR